MKDPADPDDPILRSSFQIVELSPDDQYLGQPAMPLAHVLRVADQQAEREEGT